ncbi:ferredoxin [Endothiovibrio diazotrophicus]
MNAKVQPQGSLPSLPIVSRDSEASKAIMRTLRHFHLGNPEARERLEAVAADCLPALLAPYRDSGRLRYEYPLYLRRIHDVEAELTPERLARPLSAWLGAAVAEGARLLRDNLPWIERDLRERLQGEEGPRPAKALLTAAADALAAQLALEGDSGVKLREELDALLAAVDDGDQLLGYERYPAIHLLIHTIRNVTAPRHAALRGEVEEKIRGLKRLLEVERSKSAEALAPERVKRSVGVAGLRLNPEALSKVMDHSSGSLAMSVERKGRIEQALATLRAFRDEPVLVRILYKGSLVDDSWLQSVPGFEALGVDDPCGEATAVFDREAGRLAAVFAAVRIADLELEDRYDPSIHDPWFANFSWEAFSHAELLLVPAVIALEGADRLAGEGMTSFSRLLNSGRPVQIFARVQSHNNPGCGRGEDPFRSFRTELGYLATAHRQAFVSQTSAARHDHLLRGYLDSLSATRTSIHLINTGLKGAGGQSALNAWLVAGAALEGRVHPFFRVNPGLGDSAAERVGFDGNPQPERDWPLHPFHYRDESGSAVEVDLPFTFADYCLLMENLRDHYAEVPAECESDDLVTIGDYLANGKDDQVPFVWAVGRDGTLHRAVISRTLVHACCDRRNFWRTLQELAGVKNRHVELAVEAARAEIQAAADADIARIREECEAALQAARAEAAGEVMGRLTDVLMGMDFTSGAPRPSVAAGAAKAPAAPVVESEPEPVEAEAEQEEESLGGDEPWIDTPLCTSCNDCLKVNPQVFVYNDENQAYLTNVEQATYAQLVEAAELCPSKCIHPGQPTNSGEAGLDELRLRAAAFN